MFRRTFIQNLSAVSTLSLVPFTPFVLQKEYFERCEIIRIKSTQLKYNTITLRHIQDRTMLCRVPCTNYRDMTDTEVFNRFKENLSQDFRSMKYIHVVSCGKYTGYMIDQDKWELK